MVLERTTGMGRNRNSVAISPISPSTLDAGEEGCGDTGLCVSRVTGLVARLFLGETDRSLTAVGETYRRLVSGENETRGAGVALEAHASFRLLIFQDFPQDRVCGAGAASSS